MVCLIFGLHFNFGFKKVCQQNIYYYMKASKGLGIEGKVRSAMFAASQLAVEGPTYVEDAPAPAC